jgi:NAD(P)-dependent dehydrogenase (short-subunit alcohol dehydrogenase family)
MLANLSYIHILIKNRLLFRRIIMNYCKKVPITFPPQKQNVQPGIESIMVPRPISILPGYKPSNKLSNKVAIITGGDSGIGRAVAYAYAMEGADICIIYLNEHSDAQETKCNIESIGRKCLLISGDIGDEDFCKNAVKKCMNYFRHIDILVNNAAVQFVQDSIEDISKEQLELTFRTNIFSMFYMSKAVIPHLKPGDCIINTSSITAYEGNEKLIDYSATKGAISTFTYSLATSLINKCIRVNAVAPGPIWTPLIPASYSAKEVSQFGLDAPMKRAGQPAELAPTYVYLASNDSSYVSGQVIHVNGGTIVHG